MSLQSPNTVEGPKKAVHVKWAGKTIALGTFPIVEAEDKCARAKALTRSWRSTMRPLPSREWVITELENRGIRVVSGRPGRKSEGGAKEEGGGREAGAGGGVDRMTSETDFDELMRRRSSSLGLSSIDENDGVKRRSSSLGLGVSAGLEETYIPPHRPLVGGASAAAYEAARADHYSNLASQKGLSTDSPSLGMTASLPRSGPGFPISPNQHYEMLKLHHMNLLNEIQETTLMMNLYQQQQLQQRLQQKRGSDFSSLGALSSTSGSLGMDSSYGSSRLSSDVFGRSKGIDASVDRTIGTELSGDGKISGDKKPGSHATDKQDDLEEEQMEVEERLQRIKDEIAKRQREVDELEAAAALSRQPLPHKAMKARKRRSSMRDKEDIMDDKSEKKVKQNGDK